MSGGRGVKRPQPATAPPPSGESPDPPWKRPAAAAWQAQHEEIDELKGPQGWCPMCKMFRAKCFRQGDWACELCGQHNYPDKTFCSNYRCQEKRGTTVTVVEMSQEEDPPELAPPRTTGWCYSCQQQREECWKPNDWECPWCKNHNYARKQVPRLSERVAAECSAGWECGFACEVCIDMSLAHFWGLGLETWIHV